MFGFHLLSISLTNSSLSIFFEKYFLYFLVFGRWVRSKTKNIFSSQENLKLRKVVFLFYFLKQFLSFNFSFSQFILCCLRGRLPEVARYHQLVLWDGENILHFATFTWKKKNCFELCQCQWAQSKPILAQPRWAQSQQKTMLTPYLLGHHLLLTLFRSFPS